MRQKTGRRWRSYPGVDDRGHGVDDNDVEEDDFSDHDISESI